MHIWPVPRQLVGMLGAEGTVSGDGAGGTWCAEAAASQQHQGHPLPAQEDVSVHLPPARSSLPGWGRRACSGHFRAPEHPGVPGPRAWLAPCLCASVSVGMSGGSWQHGHLSRDMTVAGAYRAGPISWGPGRGRSSGGGEEKPVGGGTR